MEAVEADANIKARAEAERGKKYRAEAEAMSKAGAKIMEKAEKTRKTMEEMEKVEDKTVESTWAWAEAKAREKAEISRIFAEY